MVLGYVSIIESLSSGKKTKVSKQGHKAVVGTELPMGTSLQVLPLNAYSKNPYSPLDQPKPTFRHAKTFGNRTSPFAFFAGLIVEGYE